MRSDGFAVYLLNTIIKCYFANCQLCIYRRQHFISRLVAFTRTAFAFVEARSGVHATVHSTLHTTSVLWYCQPLMADAWHLFHRNPHAVRHTALKGSTSAEWTALRAKHRVRRLTVHSAGEQCESTQLPVLNSTNRRSTECDTMPHTVRKIREVSVLP
jgi:hypothetical protein